MLLPVLYPSLPSLQKEPEYELSLCSYFILYVHRSDSLDATYIERCKRRKQSFTKWDHPSNCDDLGISGEAPESSPSPGCCHRRNNRHQSGFFFLSLCVFLAGQQVKARAESAALTHGDRHIRATGVACVIQTWKIWVAFKACFNLTGRMYSER